MYQLRDYQREAVDRGVEHLQTGKGNGLMVLPTGSGKSLVIASIAYRLDAPVLVLQPSQEILVQNYEKMRSYGVECSIFSASVGVKKISRITFAMIGSIKAQSLRFYRFRHLIIDECHYVNPDGGMYSSFIRASRCKVLGLTATPYRLFSSRIYGSMLRFLTRMKPNVFSQLVYMVQVGELSRRGYLSPLKYYDVPVIDPRLLTPTRTGEEYTEQSVRMAYADCQYADALANIIQRLMIAGRRHILVFTRFVEEAENLVKRFGTQAAVVTGGCSDDVRRKTLEDFKQGKISVVANVGVLTTGFDFPALDCVVLARPTRSLSLYYQMVGRAIRPYEGKTGWVVDLCGTFRRFGRVDELEIREPRPYQYAVFSGAKQLTNVYFD